MSKTTRKERPGQTTEPPALDLPPEIELPKPGPNGMVRLGFEVTPAMYRNLVRASDKLFSRIDLAATSRMFLKKGIYETLERENERESF